MSDAPDSLVLHLEGFDGPLDLLLDLARAQKVDLAKISILALVEQYLAVIESARRVRLELAAEWLVMAAWLTWLKSRLLVPAGPDDAEEAGDAASILAARLRDLSAIRTAAAWLGKRPQLGQEVFARGAPEDHTEIDRSRFSLDLSALVRAYLTAVRRGTKAKRYRARALTLWTVQDALRRLGALVGTLPDWTSLEQFLPETLTGPHRAAGGNGLHLAGRAGDGARRRGDAATGPGVWPDSGACRPRRGRGGGMSDLPDPPPDAPAEAAETATPSPETAPVASEAATSPPETAPVASDAAAVPPDEHSVRLAEALVFSSAAPVTQRALRQLLPQGMDADAVIEALRTRYAGSGVELVEVAGGVQFRTAPDLAPLLRKVVEVPRRLPRVAMETLAIIAYHQPVTRPEIEEIRGTALSQQTLDTLLEGNLIAPKGRRESPGRPTLWGTTPQFLAQFGLHDLRDLPRREDLLLEPPQPVKEGGGDRPAESESDAARDGTRLSGAQTTQSPPASSDFPVFPRPAIPAT